MNVALQPLPTTAASPATVPVEVFWRISVAQYHGMIDAGILTDDDPVELLGGWLLYKMPKKPRHRLTTRLLRSALEGIVPEGWYVDSQEPITTADSEPEPDVVVVRGRPEDYADRHPGPGDLALVIEVADATLQRDRTLKKQLYAQAGIPAYWIANLPESQLEVYGDPSAATDPPDYRYRRVFGMDDEVEVSVEGALKGRITVGDVLRS